jgi:ribosomal protein L37E
VTPPSPLYDALKPEHDALRDALDHLRQMEVTTDTPPAEIESIDARRRETFKLVEGVERVLHALRVADYVERVRAAAAEPLPAEAPSVGVRPDPATLTEYANCASKAYHETHRYCPSCSWTEDAAPYGTKKLRLQINRGGFAGHGVYAQMTGQELKQLPSPPIPDDHDLFRVVPGHEDEIVRPDEVLTIADFGGGLRLFSTPRFINAG